MKQLVLAWLFLLLHTIAIEGQVPIKFPSTPLRSIHLVAINSDGEGDALIPLWELIAKGERTILNFVTARCSHSQKQLESVQSVLRSESKSLKRSGNSVPVVFVFVDSSLAKIRRTLRKTSLSSLMVWDRDRKLSELLKVKVTPTIVVIGRDAKPIRTYEGFFSPDPKAYQDFFAKLVQAVVKGSPLPPRPIHFYAGSSEGSCTPAG